MAERHTPAKINYDNELKPILNAYTNIYYWAKQQSAESYIIQFPVMYAHTKNIDAVSVTANVRKTIRRMR